MKNITVAVGDIHGCLEELRALVRHVLTEFPDHEYKIQWVFLGDYIDRGPDSKGVINYVQSMIRDSGAIALKGNHEDMLVRAWTGDDYLRYQWDHSYGEITTKSFGAAQCWAIPESYIRWMQERPYYYEQFVYAPLTKVPGLVAAEPSRRVFVHAGIQRNLALTAQSKEYMIWARHEFMLDPDDSVFVVHGHTPTHGEPDLRHNRVNLDTGCVYSGLLTAAVFSDKVIKPSHFVFHTGAVKRM